MITTSFGPPGRRLCRPGGVLAVAVPARVPGSAAIEPGRRCGQPPLKGEISGFVPEYRPAGFGYQTQTCIVYRSGCQKKNAAPEPGAVAGQSCWEGSGTNVPSS